jgi:hypothetical protein
VPPRLSAVERIRAQIDELFASDQEPGQVLEQVARLSVRLVMQAALEAEVSEFFGRDRYQRGQRERIGYRNGHTELTVKTTAGPVVLERPKVPGTSQPFVSRLLGKGVSRTNALEALVISGFVRGLGVGDVEAALAEVLGPEAALSKSTVSRICQAIKTEFDAWKTRDLSGTRAGVPVPGRVPLQDAPRRAGRAGAVRLGHHQPGQPGPGRPGTRRPRGPRPLGRLPGRAGGAWAALTAAGDHRRRARADRRRRGHLRPQPASALCDPSLSESARQGAHPRPGGGQAGVLADLRRHRRRARRGCGGGGPPAGDGVRQALPRPATPRRWPACWRPCPS